ncbi:uncharacterized protein CIMG_11537 [Coccidioides immitis RS]|uniref:Uncharacterized protein n=1 Tax=Coccidioides immitis (strain RS) TaxID=246410 RepID=A0A0D8JW74_COCIM|nr:uncharacterized protein CIMG_11537 [Coccidioides immitis RS]KJF61161.1 hypothetical protein CIMG_11537 [Coccidioides immitis RS]
MNFAGPLLRWERQSLFVGLSGWAVGMGSPSLRWVRKKDANWRGEPSAGGDVDVSFSGITSPATADLDGESSHAKRNTGRHAKRCKRFSETEGPTGCWGCLWAGGRGDWAQSTDWTPPALGEGQALEPSRLTPGGPQRIDSVRLQRVDGDRLNVGLWSVSSGKHVRRIIRGPHGSEVDVHFRGCRQKPS